MTRRIIYTLVRAAPLLLLGLAPGGGYLAANIAACAGGLLHRLFTLTTLGLRYLSVARSGRSGSLSRLRPGCCPVPCSMECGLSSESISRPATIRPTWGNFIIP